VAPASGSASTSLPREAGPPFRTHVIGARADPGSVHASTAAKVSDIPPPNAIDASQSKRLAPDGSSISHPTRVPVPPPRRAPPPAAAEMGGLGRGADAHPVTRSSAGDTLPRDRRPLPHDRPRADVLEQLSGSLLAAAICSPLHAPYPGLLSPRPSPNRIAVSFRVPHHPSRADRPHGPITGPPLPAAADPDRPRAAVELRPASALSLRRVHSPLRIRWRPWAAEVCAMLQRR